MSYNSLFGYGSHTKDAALVMHVTGAGDSAQDRSANAYTGTWTGSAAYGTPVFGSGKSLVFNGSEDVSYGDVLKFPNGSDFSAGLWVKNPTNSAGYTFGHSHAYQSGWAFKSELGGFYAYVGSAKSVNTPCGSGWQHMALDYTDSVTTIRTYLNSIEVATYTGAKSPSTGTLRLASRNGSVFLTGELFHPYVFTRKLTSGERSEVHSGPEPLNSTAPVLATDGTVTSGTWDSQSNGTITRTTYLRLASDDSLVATLFTANPDFSSYVTPGTTYYVVERASNNGGYDEAEDTQSNTATIAITDQTINLELVTEAQVLYDLTILNPRKYNLNNILEENNANGLNINNPKSYSIGSILELSILNNPNILNPKLYKFNNILEFNELNQLSISNNRTYLLDSISEANDLYDITASLDKTIYLNAISEINTLLSLELVNPRSYILNTVFETSYINHQNILNPKTKQLNVLLEASTPFGLNIAQDNSILLESIDETGLLHDFSVINSKTYNLNIINQLESIYSIGVINNRIYDLARISEQNLLNPISINIDQTINIDNILEESNTNSLLVVNHRKYLLEKINEQNSGISLLIFNPKTYILNNINENNLVKPLSVIDGNINYSYYYYYYYLLE